MAPVLHASIHPIFLGWILVSEMGAMPFNYQVFNPSHSHEMTTLHLSSTIAVPDPTGMLQ